MGPAYTVSSLFSHHVGGRYAEVGVVLAEVGGERHVAFQHSSYPNVNLAPMAAGQSLALASQQNASKTCLTRVCVMSVICLPCPLYVCDYVWRWEFPTLWSARCDVTAMETELCVHHRICTFARTQKQPWVSSALDPDLAVWWRACAIVGLATGWVVQKEVILTRV
jgi:hypothetical protein